MTALLVVAGFAAVCTVAGVAVLVEALTTKDGS